MLDMNVIPLELHDTQDWIESSQSMPRFQRLPASPAHSLESRRLLASNARRNETAAIREHWKQQQAATLTSSRRRIHPLSAPAYMPAPLTSLDVTSALRKRSNSAVSSRLSTSSRSSKDRQPHVLQFPLLEKEINKGNLTERLPYCVPVHVDSKRPNDYPTNHGTAYGEVFFLPAKRNPGGGQSPYCSTPRKERFFVDPEWSSENVSKKRFLHRTNPDMFRFCWM